MFKDFLSKNCECGRMNFIKYSIACGKQLAIGRRAQNKKIFLDIERVKVDQEAPPLSIAVVIMAEEGGVEKKKEIFILPEGDHPSNKHKICA